ncbi:MAG: hypothetical protein EOP64_00260 [Sphingomonas sp.]|nr:MAG: hypothetical protein EOP64_00260 [Sphingomonas sp.]
MWQLQGPVYLLEADESLQCLRPYPAAGSLQDGKWQSVPPMPFAVHCTVQPASMRDLQLLPEGDRVRGALSLWQPMNMGVTSITARDLVLREGCVYQVQMADDWGSYVQARLVRVEADGEDALANQFAHPGMV